MFNLDRQTGYWLALTAILSCGLFFFIFQLYRFPFSLPFGYQGDAFFSTMMVKHLGTFGFSLSNPELGFPFGLQLQDFPFNDGSFFIVVMFLSLFSKNPFVVANLFLLLSFVFCSLTAFISFRWLKISPLLAVGGSLLFSFLPYHLIRGSYHLFLSGYWVVPLVCALSLWLLSLEKKDSLPSNFSAKKYILGIGLALLVATSGFYYALFSLFLIGVSGGVGFLKNKNRTALYSALCFSALVILLLAIQFWPSFRFSQLHEKNTAVGVRQAFEVDNNSLSLLRLALPLQSFGIAKLEPYRFQSHQPLVRMEERQFLGMAGLVGLGVIFARALLFPATTSKKQKIWWSLLILVLAIFTLALPGGLNSIIAYTLTPQIRAYSRLLPFLAFLALFGLLQIMEELHSRSYLKLHYLFSLAFLSVALWLQLSWYQPPAASIQAEFASDQAFFAQIDQLKPRAVYQLPYKAFPETPPIDRLNDYDLLKGYLHTQQPIAWSYAAIKGRAGDQWLAKLAELPLNIQLEKARQAGFEGISVDRFGYADNGLALEASLSALLNAPLVISQNQRLVYYQL